MTPPQFIRLMKVLGWLVLILLIIFKSRDLLYYINPEFGIFKSCTLGQYAGSAIFVTLSIIALVTIYYGIKELSIGVYNYIKKG